ncbi:nucleotidyltransferase family protein [Pleionea mediterranea]|uniref:CBS domain protein n=1 Tax=Pleionea mediterranea TaxID=523701 RepID=A0A316FNA9_9GAMM|nr:nucleotidyltransferase family protein [Pleionea mediterranea]PWK49166.1 CBS domain protein [Pleionea mediterranea]
MSFQDDRWKSACVSSTDSIRDVIGAIDRSAIRAALVTDNEYKLLGIVTDGDIRRGLLNYIDLDESVTKVMNSNPVYCTPADSTQKILTLMARKNLLHLPVVDDHKVVGLVVLEQLMKTPKRSNPVFLMAGGFGTRLKPLTDDCPKPLLKVGSKPILETIIESFIEYGFYKFYISTHYLADQIKDYFGDGSAWGIEIHYVHENEPLGTAGALGLLPDTTPQLPLIMMNGDLLTKVNFDELLSFHEKKGAVATMCVSSYGIKVPYGVIETDGEIITSIVEKPTKQFFINAGIYVLSPDVFSKIEANKKQDMPDLIQQYIKRNKQVSMFPIHEYWLDIGKMPDFEKAQDDIIKGN